jgi:hypothetical protein
MSDQTQNQGAIPPPETPPTPPAPPTYRDWREQRHAERMARRAARRQMYAGRPYGWFWGAILVLLGIFFLLQNLGVNLLVNWWAIFILIPAFWAFLAAWSVYREAGSVNRGVAGSLAAGLILTALALVFLLNLSLGVFWPIILIFGGLALLISAFIPG